LHQVRDANGNGCIQQARAQSGECIFKVEIFQWLESIYKRDVEACHYCSFSLRIVLVLKFMLEVASNGVKLYITCLL
jgi:hypothetical protein